MTSKKIVSLLSILLLTFAAPLAIPRAQAWHSASSYVISGFVVQDFSDSYLVGPTVNAAREGSTLTFNVRIVADGSVGQRNVTVGVKFDWMTSYVNASNANPTTTYPLKENQLAIIPVSVGIPTVASSPGINTVTHTWTIRLWAWQQNTTSLCPPPAVMGQVPLSGCQTINSPGSPAFAVYSNAQADGALTWREADSKITQLDNTLGRLITLPPGASNAISFLSQARAERDLGSTAWGSGNFTSAKTHYTSALNAANNAASSLSTQGGGIDSADFWNRILQGTGIILAGAGAILTGVGAFLYLRKKSMQKSAV